MAIELLPVGDPGKVTKYFYVACDFNIATLQALLRVMEQTLCQAHLLLYSILVNLK